MKLLYYYAVGLFIFKPSFKNILARAAFLIFVFYLFSGLNFTPFIFSNESAQNGKISSASYPNVKSNLAVNSTPKKLNQNQFGLISNAEIASSEVPIPVNQLSYYFASVPKGNCQSRPSLAIFQHMMLGDLSPKEADIVNQSTNPIDPPSYHQYVSTIVMSGLSNPFDILKIYQKDGGMVETKNEQNDIHINTRLKKLAKIAAQFQMVAGRQPTGKELLSLELVQQEQGEKGVIEILSQSSTFNRHLTQEGAEKWYFNTLQVIYEENSSGEDLPQSDRVSFIPNNDIQRKSPAEIIQQISVALSEATYWPESMSTSLLTLFRGAQWNNDDYLELAQTLDIEPMDRDSEFIKSKRLITGVEKLMTATSLDKACFN